MNWWSPVSSANWSTRSWVIVNHLPSPSSWPTSAFSSATVVTTSGAGMGHLPRRLALVDRQVEDALAVVVGVAPERLEVLGALEVEVEVELPGEADPAVHL